MASAATPPPPEQEGPPGDPMAVARAICLRMLERKARSRSELAQALTKRGVPDDAARRVLDRFGEVGLIDDAALAELVASTQHRERGLARRAVATKLRQRGFDDAVVGAALDGIDQDDEHAKAFELATRRSQALVGLPVAVQTRRLVGLLARKGYGAATAYQVVKQVLADSADAAVLLEADTADL
ncbi:MAG: regulatory protein RecX [Jatrophihabitans sp.]